VLPLQPPDERQRCRRRTAEEAARKINNRLWDHEIGRVRGTNDVR
jgi:hypothetical protein